MNRLGVDYGSKRTGIAIARSNLKIAHPLCVVSTADVMSHLQRIITDEQIGELIIGLPRSLRGQDTEQTTVTRGFIADCTKNITIPIITQDEAATTARAHDLGATEDIDAVAASIILQDYLEQL